MTLMELIEDAGDNRVLAAMHIRQWNIDNPALSSNTDWSDLEKEELKEVPF